MDTRESKTPEEELEHLKDVKEPEDFDNPEPDATQPEARKPSGGMYRLLPIVIVVVGILVAGLLMFSGAE